jgi:hypothetical protein
MRERVIAEYHAMLNAESNLTPEFLSGMRAQMQKRRLTYGDRPLGVALRPHILTGDQYAKLSHASETLAGAFEKIVAALISNPSLLPLVGLLENEQRLALVDPGFASSAVTTRLDAFVHGDEIKFIEYNAENPSSLHDQEGLNEILFEIPALKSLAASHHLRRFDPPRSLLRTILSTFKEWGGTGVPQVAIVDWANLPTANEFILVRESFLAQGVPTIICTPDELEYDGAHLRCGDFRIDVIYKRIIIHELLARSDETHPFLRAYLNRHVCMINPFRCKIAHKKAAFELLTNEDYANWFTDSEREVIRNTVPWTRRVSARRTKYDGREIDLLEFVRRRRESLVLKPNDDYGGHGICLGHRASEGEWDAMIETALTGDYIVQEIVELQMEEFPIFNEREWAMQPMYVDTNPFLFNGKVEGALVRLSNSPVINVTSGGGETGFIVVDG